MKISFLSCLVFIFVFSVLVSNAQTTEHPTTCESDSSYLDALTVKAKDKDLVIVIARMGKRERNNNLNKRRLHNVKAYLTEYRKGSVFSTHPENIILASGNKTNGLGVVEIYFQGSLFGKFYLYNNEDLFVGECAIDLEFVKTPCDLEAQKVFYPCLDKKKRK